MSQFIARAFFVFSLFDTFSMVLASPPATENTLMQTSSQSPSNQKPSKRKWTPSMTILEDHAVSSTSQASQIRPAGLSAQRGFLNLATEMVSSISRLLNQSDRASLKVAAISRKFRNSVSESSSSSSHQGPLDSRVADHRGFNFYNGIQGSTDQIELINYQSSVEKALRNFLPRRQVYAVFQVLDFRNLPYMPNESIRSLNLSGSNVTEKDLAFIKDYFPHLERLELRNTTFGSIGLRSISKLSRLKYLDLSDHYALPYFQRASQPKPSVRPFTVSSLNLLSHLKELHTLNLSGNSIQDEQIAVLPSLPALTHLHLAGHRLTDESLGLLSQLTQLELLNLSSFRPVITSRGVQAIGALVHLKSLDLTGVNFENGNLHFLAPLKELLSLKLAGTKLPGAALRHLTGFTQLQELDLSANIGIQGGSGFTYLQSLTQLRKLNLNNTLLRSEDLTFLSSFTQLEKLGLQRTGITNEGLQKIRALTNLRELDLSYNYNSTNHSGFHELAHLVHLTNLNLSHTFISETDFEVLSYFRGLEFLDLSNSHFTLSSFKYLSNLVQIKTLSIAENDLALDIELKNLESLKNLIELDLRGNTMTSRGFSCLAPLALLRSLDLGSPVSIPSGINSLKELSKLRSLSVTAKTEEDFETIGQFSQLRRLDLEWAPDPNSRIVAQTSSNGIYPNDVFRHFNSLSKLNFFSIKGAENLTNVGIHYIAHLSQLVGFYVSKANLKQNLDALLRRLNPSLKIVDLDEL